MVKTETKWHNKNRSGFTLLELLVVVGILAALVALALPFYQDYVNQSKLTAAEADLQTFKKALAMYDQLESSSFASTNLTGLIGKYMQDYRTFNGQVNPVDPWGNDYQILPQEGVVMSWGPDGQIQTDITTGDAARRPLGDDILVTWKPPFFVSSVRAVNQNTVEVVFSRKIKYISGAATLYFTINNTTVKAATNVIKVSDTVYRFITTANLVKLTTYTVTAIPAVGKIEGQDNKASFDSNPSTGTTGATASFTY